MAYCYKKLLGKIREKFGKQDVFATALGISPSSLSLKLNNKTDWKRVEIERACKLLDIPLEEASLYFFVPLVEKTQQS